MVMHGSTRHTHAWVLLGCCWGAAGVLLGCCWGSAGVLLGCCWGAAGVVLGCCWGAAGVLLWLLLLGPVGADTCIVKSEHRSTVAYDRHACTRVEKLYRLSTAMEYWFAPIEILAAQTPTRASHPSHPAMSYTL